VGAFSILILIDNVHRADLSSGFGPSAALVDYTRPDGDCAHLSSRPNGRSKGVCGRMRLGLFGGTFDPIHIGHLILAEQCREACRLDKVWIVVANEPPHKRGIPRTAVHHRLEMARLAIAGNPGFAASDIEADRSGPSYSVDTLAQVQEERPGDELFFLIGKKWASWEA